MMKKRHIVGIILLLIIFVLFASYIPKVFANDSTGIVDIDK